eukprot:scaffold161950_cov31-Prasinocladus_malaysianus.AAC.3
MDREVASFSERLKDIVDSKSRLVVMSHHQELAFACGHGLAFLPVLSQAGQKTSQQATPSPHATANDRQHFS